MKESEVLEKFGQGFDCGQVVFSSCAEKLGLDKETTLKIASCFGAGMFCANTCGAVSGALMAIGAKYGHTEPNTPDVKNAMVGKNMEFQQAFVKEYGSTVCREILGYDLTIPEQMAEIEKKQLMITLCPKVVCFALNKAQEIIADK